MFLKFFRPLLLGLGLLALTSGVPFEGANPDKYHRFSLPFYAEPISIEYDPGMMIGTPAEISDDKLRKAYREYRRRPVAPLLNSLLRVKEQYQLNDYLFCKLAKTSLQVIYHEQPNSANAQEITLYGMLIDAGFDARLTFRKDRVFVNIYTAEELFEVPIIDVAGRPYANISCLDRSCNGQQRLYVHRDQPNPAGRSFGFQLREWPALSPQPIQKDLEFTYNGRPQRLQVTFDRTMVDIMSDYPFVNEYCYLETPLSPTLRASLLPQLRRELQPLTPQQQLEFLASFTRSAFNYKEDNENFGHSKPMVPEELFGYNYSDCEDRSALFFALVRDLLDTPMAVIAYDDHLTIAVASDDIKGDAFEYKGLRYVFCDPTGPKHSSRIGRIPPGYENKKFNIIGQYK